jgi:hypothetical protein
VDGNNVIFRNLNSAKPELYSFNGSSFQRLVTTNSLLPGLSANRLSTVGQAPALAKTV